MRLRIVTIVSIALQLILVGLVSTAAADPSPTGREPRLLWTAERQAVWNRMKADYRDNPANPGTLGGNWYKVVKENAECGCRYADTGLWATLMYQWTGEKKYVDLAWAKVSQFVKRSLPNTVGNYIREYGMENVIMLDWLWPGLSSSQRTQFADAIAAMNSNSLKGSQPLRLNDSDQVVGTYFSVALFYLANPDDPRALESFRHPQIGGLDATAADFANARNTIKTYVEQLAAGGEWFESAEYNLGTVNLLLMGAEAVRTADKKDHFPEVTQWTPLWARRQMAYWTPDLAQVYQWGDEEHPRERRYFAWTNASGMAAGLLQGTLIGAQLQQHLLDLVSKYGHTGYNTMEPIVTGRLFFTFNPYAPGSDWRTAKTFYAKGVGLTLQRSGFGADDSLFAVHVANRPARRTADHFVSYLNDFELWRRGEWVITHPRGYGGAPNGGLGTNAVLMQGFGDMPGFKELVGVAAGDTYAYQAGTTGGASVRLPFYQPPPVFVHEWTRSVLYLSSQTDTIVVYDRAHVTDVLGRDRYSAQVQGQIDKAPSPKQWLLHMPVVPRISSTAAAITWTTPGGQTVQWHPLLPANSVKTPFDEAALRKAGDAAWKANVNDSELKHHVKVWPSVKKDFDTFLNVIQVGEPGQVSVVSVPGEVEGARISRPGAPDVLALFNALPSARLDPAPYHPSHDDALRRAHLRSSGFSVRWTADADSTEVFVADLDPGKRWVAELDGRIWPSSSAASSDLMRLLITGAGTHSLVLRVTGEPGTQHEMATPPSPSGLRITR